MNLEKNNLTKNKKMRILTLLLFFSFLSVTGQEKKQPNIVLIMAEDISTDLACYGMKAVKHQY